MKRKELTAIASVLFSLFGIAAPCHGKPDVLMVIVDQWNPRFMNYEPGSQVITFLHLSTDAS